MAIVHPGDERFPGTAARCFLCSEGFEDIEPAAYWSGPGIDIHLHGGCVGSFVLRVARDAWELERDAGDGKFSLNLRKPGWTLPPGR